MKISLTWANYALIISVCLVVYYLILVLLFYRKGFGSLTATKEVQPSFESYKQSLNNDLSDRKSNLNLFGEEVDEDELKFVSERDELTPDAQDFADEIGAYTSSCGEVDKDELIAHLRKNNPKISSSLCN